MKKKSLMKIDEAAENLGIPTDVIVEFISYQWIQPLDLDLNILDDEDIARLRLIWELQQDLGVNNEAVPIILHLIDQLNHLHKKINK